MNHPVPDREAIGELPNPLGLAGIEFIEYATQRPQALGQVLERLGFKPVARHRSREVLLYRQGGMNVVINAHRSAPPAAATTGTAGATGTADTPPDHDAPPQISAIALRVRDAAAAFERSLARGAWAVPTQVAVMELNIPAVHGVGGSRIYFVDRWQEFSIWDVDFVPIPGVEARPKALAGLHWFGLVQYIGSERMADWCEFYRELFGFALLPEAQHFGILPKGRILQSPCRNFYLQLIEPDPGADEALDEAASDEQWQRIGLGAPDVAAAVVALAARGVGFVDSGSVHVEGRGALTTPQLGGVMFELVHDEGPA